MVEACRRLQLVANDAEQSVVGTALPCHEAVREARIAIRIDARQQTDQAADRLILLNQGIGQQDRSGGFIDICNIDADGGRFDQRRCSGIGDFDGKINLAMDESLIVEAG